MLGSCAKTLFYNTKWNVFRCTVPFCHCCHLIPTTGLYAWIILIVLRLTHQRSHNSPTMGHLAAQRHYNISPLQTSLLTVNQDKNASGRQGKGLVKALVQWLIMFPLFESEMRSPNDIRASHLNGPFPLRTKCPWPIWIGERVGKKDKNAQLWRCNERESQEKRLQMPMYFTPLFLSGKQ